MSNSRGITKVIFPLNNLPTDRYWTETRNSAKYHCPVWRLNFPELKEPLGRTKFTWLQLYATHTFFARREEASSRWRLKPASRLLYIVGSRARRLISLIPREIYVSRNKLFRSRFLICTWYFTQNKHLSNLREKSQLKRISRLVAIFTHSQARAWSHSYEKAAIPRLSVEKDKPMYARKVT